MTRDRWKNYLIALVAVVVAPPVLGHLGVLSEFRASHLATAMSFAIAALALNVVMGYAGQVSLGHWALAGVGAFTAAKVTDPLEIGLPFTVGVLAAAFVTGLFALIAGLPSLRLRGVYLAVATIGMAFALEQSLFQSTLLSKGSGGVTLPRPWVGTFEFSSNADYLAVVLVLLVIVWLLDSNLLASRIGRGWHAVRADEDVAASFGVDVGKAKLGAFVVSGVFAGIGGAAYGHLFNGVNFQSFEFSRSLLLVIIVVVGGLGSRVWVLVAAAFYGVFPLVLDEIWGNDAIGWDLIVGAAMLMYTIAQEPGGLAGAYKERLEEKAKKEAEAAGALDAPDTDEIPPLPDLPRPSGLPERATLAAGQPVLSVRDVTVDFGGLRAVDGASIEVMPNRIVGLIGPNGAGKTTLFNVVSGLVAPTAGRIEMVGTDISELPPHRRAGLGMARTFQNVGLAKDRSVFDNLLMAQHQVATYPLWSILAGLGPAPTVEDELAARADEAIAALDFDRFRDTPIRNLSGGQQRLIEIACALVTAPELVLLDEPSAGMAPGAVENLAVRLRDLRDQLGRTVLLIEHNIPLVTDVCDEVYVLASGSIIAHGRPDDVVRDPAVIEAYLGGQGVPA